MISKLFDCQLEHWPLLRIMVEVPETAQEVLTLLSDDHRQAVATLSEANDNSNAEHSSALLHESGRLSVLQSTFKAVSDTWHENHAEPSDSFEKDWPQLFIESGFAKRFAVADARSEYFRLYGLTRTCAQFTCVEVVPTSSQPAAEHTNWTKIRKQIKTHGTDRKSGLREALLTRINASIKQANEAAAAAARESATAKPAQTTGA